MVKYVYGHDFKAANGEKNHETESNVILNYAFQQPLLKALPCNIFVLTTTLNTAMTLAKTVYSSITQKF